MREIDFLFLHPTTHYYREGSDLVTFITMPMGTLALADLLEGEGYSTLVVNTGIEQMYDRGFRVEELLRKYSPRVVGIDLHWFVHAHDAIRLAHIAKEHGAYTVLGGFTATYFAQEILREFRCVDAVIRGDAEQPLLELMAGLRRGDLSGVSNLLYRKGSSIKAGGRRFIADEEELGRLDYANFRLLYHHERYLRAITQSGDLDPYAWKLRLKRHAWLPLGRGCSVDCSYCGGGRRAHRLLTGRENPIYHPKEQVVETLGRLEEEGIDSTYMDFDPYPDRRYYLELFTMVRREGIDISVEFALWSPSNRAFIREFSRTFNPLYSTLVLSPEAGSEEVRRRNKGLHYTNHQLLKWLRMAEEELVPVEIYFSTGLSWESFEDFEETLKLAENVVEEYPIVSISCNPLVMEPACPRFLEPKRYGVRLRFREFLDYYHLFKALAEGRSPPSQLGYDTQWQSEPQIIKNSLRFQRLFEAREPDRWRRLLRGEEMLRLRARTI
jgi:radical SAM superfamily enzyme YgiQ (UPF0313 family)